MGIRGVNLGGWLVYEKWMQSPLLKQITSDDDHDMVRDYSKEYLGYVLRNHWDNYINGYDFQWMSEVGVDTVRLPIPYHLFGTEHHIPCVEYVDKAMDWAADNGIGVLLDLHTVPMGQNAFDNGGYTGMCRWHMSRKRVEWTLDLLNRIAKRYAGHKALWGIQPLNEPATEFQMKSNKWKNRKHPDRVSVSSAMPFDKLWLFYEMFIEGVRPILGEDIRLVLHDRFELWKWSKFPNDGNIWLDTHKYIFIKERKFKDKSFTEYVKACAQYGDEVRRSQLYHPTVVGEWCLANNCDGADTEWYRAFAKEQLKAWDNGEGGFFWSYRNDTKGFENWSFWDCVNNGWLDFRREE